MSLILPCRPFCRLLCLNIKAVSKFPEVRRDLALLVDRAVAVSELEKVILSSAGDALKSVLVFDVLSGTRY